MKHIREWDMVTWCLIGLSVVLVLFFLMQVLPVHQFPVQGE
jgi:hypothetical protein